MAAALKALRAAVAEADPDALRGIVARFVEGGEAIIHRPASTPALLN